MKENNTPAAELAEKNKKIAELVSAIEDHARETEAATVETDDEDPNAIPFGEGLGENYDLVPCISYFKEEMSRMYAYLDSEKCAPAYNLMVDRAFRRHLKALPGRDKFYGVKFAILNEGHELAEYDKSEHYHIAFKLFNFLEQNMAWFVAAIFTSSGNVAFWTRIPIVNTDRYVSNCGGALDIGSGLDWDRVTILPEEYYNGGEFDEWYF